MNKQNKKKAKRLELKNKKHDEAIKAQQESDRQQRIKILSKQCDDQRVPIHIFTSVDDYIDERLPISRERQIEMIKSKLLLNNLKVIS